ncbi:MgtC/SapB family protein [Pseudoruegeria sp. SK021]|uniref:MgtC/SapB family protein n=1 Tax=Pseudoruegeria sp. SK021 TaxID=1933035 RepID=UPI000A24ABC6|nr:MgtC/SapB family protein [Pseudoruegeria sp. SK021]OSP56686.1 hypothetical protein BV911_01655 [Pseudoruegeria sp. SK021]
MFEAALANLPPDLRNPFQVVGLGTASLRLIAALILGGVIGIDREVRTKPAGLRTHMLVSVAACLFALIAIDLMNFGIETETDLRLDPLRLIEAVTAGVAFLAAGSIITSGGKIKGLTTGAGMWMAGAIGLACGVGSLGLAALATVLCVIILSVLGAMSFDDPSND